MPMIKHERERERRRETERERQRVRERDREGQRGTERERKGERDRQTERQTQRERQTDRENQTDREPDRQRDRQIERQTDRQTDRQSTSVPAIPAILAFLKINILANTVSVLGQLNSSSTTKQVLNCLRIYTNNTKIMIFQALQRSSECLQRCTFPPPQKNYFLL